MIEFKQIGNINEAQKVGVKRSARFNLFLSEALRHGSHLITVFTEPSVNGTFINLYMKNDLHNCHYWAEVGPLGGLKEEKVTID